MRMGLSVAAPASASRMLLRAPLTLNVTLAGNDATGDATHPFATPQGAYEWSMRNLDVAYDYAVTATVTGTLSGQANVFRGPLPGKKGVSSFVVQGAPGAILAGAPANFIFATAEDASVTIQDICLNPSSGGGAFLSNGGVNIVKNVSFTLNNNQSLFDTAGSRSEITALDFTILNGGSVNIMAVAEDNSVIYLSGHLTLAGVPAWGTACVQGDLGGEIDGTGFTYSGSATGRRFDGNVFTGGNPDPNFWPGNS